MSRDPRNAQLAARLRLLLTDRDFDGEDYAELMELDAGSAPTPHRKATPSEIRRLPTTVLTEEELERMRRRSREESGSGAVDLEAGQQGASQQGASGGSSKSGGGGGSNGGRRRGGECAVCLEPWMVGDEVRTLPCLHRLHTACIDPWLRQNATCPVCKYPAVGGST